MTSMEELPLWQSTVVISKHINWMPYGIVTVQTQTTQFQML